ncbi:hypothetical protein [Desulfosporosinus lacus]|uniref:Uncharacterized protein n=1 Tax=Desulfosporosinus lacus DSM 15449 TaxID=1121420 RepID=A0A1M5Q6J9_9FIRM|nr:hypothetical protein [Desulfosporosinus lacus]SHH09784.1 hypothetical protein SAMN02746098_00160 [Desulfosporosinus lacus DSM 15449]
MDYDELKDDFTQAWYHELFRRLREDGYEIDLINNHRIYANIYSGDALVCQIDKDNELSGDWSGKVVKRIAEETAEYVFAHKTAPTINCIISGMQQMGYRKLLAFNDQILAVKKIREKGYQFATGYRTVLSLNHYILNKRYCDYSKACEDFAMRAGLVDQDKLLNEAELKVIYSGLTQLIRIDPPQVTFEELTAIGQVLNKINFSILPELNLRLSLTEANNHELEELEV